MKCPNCNESFLMTERHHIEIDYCPSCRGVWLDKGELDKMLEYAAQNSFPPNSGKLHGEKDGYNRYDEKYEQGYPKRHKKKSFLGDLFDFD
jgi:Zn-finger nucleic acid-binding protein